MAEESIQQQYQRFRASHPLRQVQIAGQRWQYHASGAGSETVLLLPGGFGTADTAFQYITALECDFRVISLTYPTAATTVDQLLDGLTALLAHEQIERAHIVGGSASGLVAQCFARRSPASVASLILSHTGLPQPRRARWLAPAIGVVGSSPLPLLRGLLGIGNARFLPKHTSVHEFWRCYFAAMIQRTSHAALLNRFRILIDIDRNQHAAPPAARRLPTLIISAANDGFVPPREQRKLLAQYPYAAHHHFSAGLHSDSVTAPACEIALIQAFLRATIMKPNANK